MTEFSVYYLLLFCFIYFFYYIYPRTIPFQSTINCSLLNISAVACQLNFLFEIQTIRMCQILSADNVVEEVIASRYYYIVPVITS